MKTLRRNDHLTISQGNKRLKTLQHDSLPIPVDLVIDIFSRLPAKSVARCRCVSKQWGSIVSRQDFTELYLTRSSSHPQLLFCCRDRYNRKLFLFSAPHVQNENSCIEITNHIKFPFLRNAIMCGSVQGLVCVTYPRIFKGYKETVHVIYNPSTEKSLSSLPKVKTKIKEENRWIEEVNGYFGYDPIDKQFKVLAMSQSGQGNVSSMRLYAEHQVLTLGTKKSSWRMVDCSITHYPLSNGVCINGVMYYLAMVMNERSWITMIVCFDVRSEKFSYIKSGVGMVLSEDSVLVNYKGKLGTLFFSGLPGFFHQFVSGKTTSFQMSVLEDAEKLKWSKHVYEFPPMWVNMVGKAELYFAGVASLNEIVLAPCLISDPFYIFYYNIESKTVRRVQIQGLDVCKYSIVDTYVDHVEDVKLMDMFKTYNLRSCNKS